MNYIKTEIDGVFIIEPKIFNDSRGYFFEAFKYPDFEKNIGPVSFIQDNESKSCRGVLRGLHYQKGSYSQAKLVRVIKGCVLDVAVDLRSGSATFGKHVMVELSDENKRQFFIPRGFAHGFLVLSDEAIFTYKVDNEYSPENEASIRFDDPDLNIKWPMKSSEILTSKKDLEAVSFKDAEYFF
ncbi:dTDP-4-dehydrorhamnose 3,5-epimerase [uncultured Prevotella sp.]|uniref:dTDP-4-dehydrorhamnose 3,5-epimerase n=1 Tax=uncultured Prevotella sp. TaxID=159272 RepID=UPI002636D95E|nr:dTDP-4-dehydrorhamnose 3,5-epimerase [uncultured Prevotella sp.]